MSKNGFTLIEVVVYLGLFAILLSGFLAASFSLVEGGGKDTTHALLASEGDFLLAKINYALENGQTISAADVVPLVSTNMQMTNLLFYTATTSTDGSSSDSVGAYFTLQMRSQEGRVVSEDFFSTTTLPY